MRYLGFVKIAFLALIFGGGVCHGQAHENGIPVTEWQDKIDPNAQLTMLDTSLLGETIDLHTGGLSFSHTDIVIPGNSSLDVSIRRSLNQGQLHHGDVDAEFGDWSLVVPRLDMIVGPTSPLLTTTSSRCSGLMGNNFPQETVYIPPRMHGNPNMGGTQLAGGQKDYLAGDYSNGINLVIPGKGSESVLWSYSASTYDKPNGAKYQTKSGWYFTCAPNGADEKYIGISPDGTEYRFDKVIIRRVKDLEFFDHDPQNTNLDRWRVSVMATRVTDVHGNWVEYNYDSSNRLTSIDSNDGRQIDLTYSGNLIKTATANGRTWTYNYHTNTYDHRYWEANIVLGPDNQILKEVIQPDGLKWTFATAEMTAGPQPGENCATPALRPVFVKHPNGAEGMFSIQDVMHRTSLDARTWEEAKCRPYTMGPGGDFPECDLDCGGANGGEPVQRLKRISVVSVLGKTITYHDESGQRQTYIWSYQYESDPGPESSSINDRTNWTKVTDPEGVETTYFHKWHRERDGGSLVKTEVRDAPGGNLVETKDYSYEFENYNGTEDDWSIKAGNSFIGVFEDNVNIQPCYSTASQCFVSGLSDEPIGKPGVLIRETSVTTTRGANNYTQTKSYNLNRLNSSYSHGLPVQQTRYSNASWSTAPRITDSVFSHDRVNWIIGMETERSQNGRLISESIFDSNGKVTEHKRRGHTFYKIQYYSDGTIEWVKDGLDRQHTAANWKRGRPENVTLPDGSTYAQTIDNNGWTMSSTSGRGFTSTFERDAMGRLTKFIPSKTQNAWSDINISYNFPTDLSQPVSQTITKGNAFTKVEYDRMLRPLLVETSGTGATPSFINSTYNSRNQKTFESQPSFSPTHSDGMSYIYDALGRQTKIEEIAGGSVVGTTTSTYHSAHRHRTTDPEGNYSDTYYFGYGGPDSDEVRQIYQFDGAERIYTRNHKNIWGEVERIRQWGPSGGVSKDQSQYFEYDSRGRLCRHKTPEGQHTYFGYDDAGQMTSYAKGKTLTTGCPAPSGNNKVTLTYDLLGRVTNTDFALSWTPDITKTYDANGNVETVNRNGINWIYAYDELDQLTDETLTLDGRTYAISHDYNANSHLTGTTMANGVRSAYTLDGLGRPTAVAISVPGVWSAQTLASGLNYHPDGSLKNVTYGNGQVYARLINNRLLTQHVTSANSGQVAMNQVFGYDLNGRVSSVTDYADNGNSRTFGYDGFGRLTSATGPWGNASYSYDSLGNLLTKTLGSRTISNTYNAWNRLKESDDSQLGVRVVEYDGRGNIRQLGGQHFTYDTSDQPISISGDVSGSYRYDGNLKRVKSTMDDGSGPETIYNIYDSSGLLSMVDPLSGNDKYTYVRLGGQVSARIERHPTDMAPPTIEYQHTDHLGSPVAGTDAVGNVAWRERYTPYGEKMIGPSQLDNQAAFAGHIHDANTGLTYMQARYYDPAIGRFLSIDPVNISDNGNPNFFGRYHYAFNDPVNMIDPNGGSPLRNHYRSTGDGSLPKGMKELGHSPTGSVLGDMLYTAGGLIIAFDIATVPSGEGALGSALIHTGLALGKDAGFGALTSVTINNISEQITEGEIDFSDTGSEVMQGAMEGIVGSRLAKGLRSEASKKSYENISDAFDAIASTRGGSEIIGAVTVTGVSEVAKSTPLGEEIKNELRETLE